MNTKELYGNLYLYMRYNGKRYKIYRDNEWYTLMTNDNKPLMGASDLKSIVGGYDHQSIYTELKWTDVHYFCPTHLFLEMNA